jgi:hypothetical protein
LKTGAMALVTNPTKEQYDMKYLIKIMGLCLVAVALSAVVVASASAASEPLLRAKGGGAIVKNKFTGTSKAKLFILETKANGNIECTSLSARGEVTSSTAAESTVTFTGCKALGIANCKTEGAKGTNEIVTTVSIRPRWQVGGRGIKVGLLISLLGTHSPVIINCPGQTLHVRGTFIVPVLTFNKPASKYTFTAKQKKGVQEPIEFETAEGEKIKNTLETEGSGLKTFAFEQSGEEAEEEATFEEEVEFI